MGSPSTSPSTSGATDSTRTRPARADRG
jgi:hypothetical protein